MDAAGQVLGINSQIAFAPSPDERDMIWQSQINFALESRICERLVDEIVNNQGKVTRAFLGLELVQRLRYSHGKDGENEVARLDSLPVLLATLPTSPADAKLAEYKESVLVSVNGEAIRSLDEALGELEKVRPGQMVDLAFNRNGKTSVLKIKAATLDTKSLESIARHVTSTRLNEIVWNPDTEQPSFSIRKKGMQAYDAGKKVFETVLDYNSDERYYILAGGLHSERQQDLWRISSLSEVGAALRLSGQAGLFDMVVVNARTEQVNKMRLHLANRENVLQKTLWY